MKAPPKISPFYNKPTPDLPWSVGIEPIQISADRKSGIRTSISPLAPITDPLGLGTKIRSDSRMEALLLVTCGNDLLYEERVVHPGGVTDDEHQDNPEGEDFVGMLLAHAAHETIKHFGMYPPKIFCPNLSLALSVETYLEIELGDEAVENDIDIPVDDEGIDPHYKEIAHRRRWLYQLEETTPSPIAIPKSWTALKLDPLFLEELLDSIGSCHWVIAQRGFKDTVVSFNLSGIGMSDVTMFILPAMNMKEPISFTFVEKVEAWQTMLLSSFGGGTPDVESCTSVQPMIPEYELEGMVVHICFWPKDHPRARYIVAEHERYGWPRGDDDTYPEIWIANSPYATLTDRHSDELMLQFSALIKAVQLETTPLVTNHNTDFRDEITKITVTGPFVHHPAR